MRKLLIVTILLLSVVEVAWAVSRSGSYTMTFDLSHHPAGDETRLWIPYPVSNLNQTISSVKWEGDYSEAAVYTDRQNGTPMLSVRWASGTKPRYLTLSFAATRLERVRGDFSSKELAVDDMGFASYLAPTRLGPTDGAVKELSDQITAGKSGVLAKARAIYDWTVDHTFRDPATRGCGLGDVPKLLNRPGGKCADISSIYVALARSAGVPAREILGLRSGKNRLTDVTSWQHCWVEFYQPGYGWVPVDPADVRKAMLKQNLKLDDPAVVALREDFWGRVDANRIKLSEGRDLHLNPPQRGEVINYLMYPYAEIGSRVVDWLAPEEFKYKLTWQPES